MYGKSPTIRFCSVFILSIFVFSVFIAPEGVAQAQSSDVLSLIITSPYNGALLFQSPILVEGTIENAASGIASVTCNGNPASVVGDTFSCEVPLAQGANLIIVSAIDNEGNSASSNIEVVLEDIDQLIQTYGPVIRFHTDESYFPDDVESVLNDSRLEWSLVEQEHVVTENFSQRDAEWAAHSVTVLGSVDTSSETFMDDIEEYAMADQNSADDRFRYYPLFPDKSGSLDRAKALVRVRPWGSSHTDIQFYIFYPFNGPGRLWVELWGWETRNVAVEL